MDNGYTARERTGARGGLPSDRHSNIGAMVSLTRRALLLPAAASLLGASSRTEIAIRGDQFLLNGKPTYAGRSWKGKKIEGLLFNSRMIQGIFDDRNSLTMDRWKYPDTGKWDAKRNTQEFIAAMPEWRKHGLLSFTIGMQGGSPEGYSKTQPWETGAFRGDGFIYPEYLDRLQRILEKADELGMAPILSVFYFGQDERLENEKAVRAALKNTVDFVLARDFRNVLLEVANECDNRAYEQALLKPELIPLLIRDVKAMTRRGRRLLVGTSFNGGRIPAEAVVAASDFVILHGNGVKDPVLIAQMVQRVRKQPSYKPKPILFNEDDHFDFDKPENNFTAAVNEYASWGYFDPEGYQTPPVRWGLDTERKQGFFRLLKEITGS